jgi:hypothetical protein
MGAPFDNRGNYVTYGTTEGIAIGCMDDRPGEPWLQTGGGVYGIAQDRAAAMEIIEPGSFDELDMDVHIFTGAVTGALALAKIRGTMHHHCAAFELADTNVADALTSDNKLEELFGIAKDIYLPLGIVNEDRGWSTFMRGVKAQRQLIHSGKLASREQAERDLFEAHGLAKAGGGIYCTPERVHLSEPEHKAGDVVINHVPGYLFDGRKNWDAGHPAYHVSVGSFQEMNAPLDTHLGRQVPTGAFTLASAARHAAIISVLPKPEGQDALNVHSIRHL